jgi:tripeptide aminopeptidase
MISQGIDRERIVNRFMELVQIDSESRFERQMAKKLKKELSNLGFEVREDETGARIGSYIGNVIAKLKGNNSEMPTLCLVAHMDTVEPGKNIKPIIKDGVIYSQGKTILGADDKAGITTILTSLEYMIENGFEYGDIEVIFTVCEEAGLLGSKNLDFNELEAEMGIVYDCDGKIGTIITAGPAQDKIRVLVEGKSAHAGKHPNEGINAIKVSSIALSNMKLGQIDEETTANIGVIRGGIATNIVPDQVELKGEARSRDEEKLKLQTEHMVDIFKKSANKFYANVEIETNRLFSSFKINKDTDIVQAAVLAAERLNLEPKLVATGGGSDTNIFNKAGIPTINLGLGAKEAHTPKENIAIDDLVKAVEYNLTIMKCLKEIN